MNSDGTVLSVITQLYYAIDEVDGSSRKELRYLTTITVLPDVYSISFNLNATPRVMNLNLFEGLQELTLHGYESPTDTDRRNINLIVPASVKVCKLEEIIFGQLIFNGCDRTDNPEDQQPITLQLRCKNVFVDDKFKCLLRLTTSGDSYWTRSNNSIVAPIVVEVTERIFGCLFNNTTVDFGNGQGGHTTLIVHEDTSASMPWNMDFFRVINMTTLSATELAHNFPNAIIVG